MQQAFVRIVENIAAAHGATSEAVIEQGYPVTVNDARACDLMKACAERLGGEAGWRPMPAPMMGAEDFAYVLREVPGAMAFIGVAPEGSDADTNPPLHNTRMTIEESVMARGVAMHCAMAETFLNDGMD
jgi:hippurate hydrolase